MMARVREEMAKHGTIIELTDDARELLVEQGYDPAMVARPLRRAIQRMIEDPLADFILGRELHSGSTSSSIAGKSGRGRATGRDQVIGAPVRRGCRWAGAGARRRRARDDR
jgi:ATP-dependent Clp protease ATP-binding subunit ClpA